MGKEIGCLYKNNRSKLSTTKLKMYGFSFFVAYTSFASYLRKTYISSQLDNKDIVKNQNKKNTSTTVDIHSCVTPRKQKYSV